MSARGRDGGSGSGSGSACTGRRRRSLATACAVWPARGARWIDLDSAALAQYRATAYIGGSTWYMLRRDAPRPAFAALADGRNVPFPTCLWVGGCTPVDVARAVARGERVRAGIYHTKVKAED